MGEGVCEFIKEAFKEKNLENVNKTPLALIPKTKKPEFINQFRPISLCNMVYKSITKTMVNRLKPMLSHIISPFQASFILGQCIQDNTIIA